MTENEHARAVDIFEFRVGHAYTDEYEQSREWSDAAAEATDLRAALTADGQEAGA